MILNILYKIFVALIINIILFVLNIFVFSRTKFNIIINNKLETLGDHNFIKSFLAYLLETVGMLTLILFVNFEFTVFEAFFKSVLIIILIPIAEILITGLIGWIFRFKKSDDYLTLLVIFIIIDVLAIGGMATYLLFKFGLL